MATFEKVNDQLSHAEWVDRARELAELAWVHNRQADADRRLSPVVVDALFDSDLLRLATSRRMGGLEAHPLTLVEVGRELARGSSALGWVYGLSTAHQVYLGSANEQLQEEIRDAPQGLIADSLFAAGMGEVVDGGYALTGRWKFVSGIEWASWVGLAFVPPDAEKRVPVVGFIPASEVEIDDVWSPVGLRGTASNDVILDRVFVPRHRIFELARYTADNLPQGEVVEEGTLYRLPFQGMLGISLTYTALGTAQRAIEEFTAWTKQRVRAYEGTQASEAPYPQLTLADAIAKWDAAHALTLQFVRDMWEAAEAGRVALSPEERARMFAQRAFIVRTCSEVTNQLFLDSGAMALLDTSVMQQLWRDVNAASSHMTHARGDALTSLGRTLMGFDGHPFI